MRITRQQATEAVALVVLAPVLLPARLAMLAATWSTAAATAVAFDLRDALAGAPSDAR